MNSEHHAGRGSGGSDGALAEAGWADIAALLGQGRPKTLAIHSRVAELVRRLDRRTELPCGVQRMRLGLVRFSTVDPLLAPLVSELAARDVAAEVVAGDLNAAFRDVLDDGSFLYRTRLDGCFVLPVAQHAFPALGVLPAQDGFDQYLDLTIRLVERFPGPIVLGNFPMPDSMLLPRLQAQRSGSARYAIEALNHRLAAIAEEHARVRLCDIDRLARRMGSAAFWNERDLAMAMQPFSSAALQAIAAELAETIRLATAPPVKCVAVDLDNTLWGGVIGEDGLHAIRLGSTYPGTAYAELQRQLKELGRLGILLAIVSKNDEETALAVLREHPGAVLREEDFAARRINWKTKSENLRDLARELGLGLDSFLFIDDQPFELAQVRAELPNVRVLRIPDAAWEIPLLLPRSGLLDRLALTREDLARSDQYRQESQRRASRSTALTFDEYLRSLEMRLTVLELEPAKHLARAAQLTQKTNQLNLTTRRYSEADIERLALEGAHVFLGELVDRFGSYGAIALAIYRPLGDGRVTLDTFLMSCRALGRGVELAFLRETARRIAQLGCSVIEAEYIPTARNGVAEDLLPRAGFTALDDGAPSPSQARRYHASRLEELARAEGTHVDLVC